MEIVSRITCELSSEDMDENGHLNNARYPIYFEKGRIDLLGEVSSIESLRERNLGFVSINHSYNHLIPVPSSAIKVDIVSRFGSSSRPVRIPIEQEMFLGNSLVATSGSVYCFVDLESGMPVPPPEDLIARIR